MGRAAVAGLALALAACASQMPVPSPLTGEPTPTHPPEDAWARVLAASVDAQGRVDFAQLGANHRDLDRYVAWIYQRSPDRWPDLYRTPAHVVAYHLNAYNALALYNLATSGVPESLSVMQRREFFEKRTLFVGNQPVTLRDYRERIRQLGDPRLHFALTNHLATDPGLAREPYRAGTLDAQLDRAARAFLNDARHVHVDDDRGTVTLAPLMETYAADFLRAAPSLLAYVNHFRDTPVPARYDVGYAGIDWTVRRAPLPPPGQRR
jgi:hypothetical protein